MLVITTSRCIAQKEKGAPKIFTLLHDDSRHFFPRHRTFRMQRMQLATDLTGSHVKWTDDKE